jgi:5-methyltetrahydrofolate--homocysteine methyltransferase
MDNYMPAKKADAWVDTEGFTGEFAQFNQKGRKAIEQAERELNGDVSPQSDEPEVIDLVRSEAVDIDIDRPTRRHRSGAPKSSGLPNSIWKTSSGTWIYKP